CPNRIPVISKLVLVLDIYSSLSLIWRYSYCLVFQGATSVSDDNIEFSRFPEFYNERRNALKQRLLNRVFLTTKIDSSPSTMDTDEEILTD
ncbi:hypothetical protein, partial [Citrobacter portucalensis]|uniref:hypothetical protein n=1 Tax=Citrobacter portucalensis TaxID=1639133 RepID=UPI003B42FD55